MEEKEKIEELTPIEEKPVLEEVKEEKKKSK